MDGLPIRGPEARRLGLRLPPERMPLFRRGRPLKRWRYVGVFGPELMLCVGVARIGPLVQRFFAVVEPDGTLRGRTSLRSAGVGLEGSSVMVDSAEVAIRLELEETEPIEVVSPSGNGYIWTAKQAGARVRGAVRVGGREHRVDGEAFVDDSAGYHERRTAWRWSAGLGHAETGERVAWNLVDGVHDAPQQSERTIWVDGRPTEVGPVGFADDLASVAFAEGGALELSEWARRTERTNLLLLRSDYAQPFGRFSGELPNGLRLASGYGVMERHDVRW